VNTRSYSLREDVRIYFHNDDEIRLRKGVWNYVEAMVNLRDQPPKVRTFFRHVVDRLSKEQEVDVERLASEANLLPDEASAFQKMFDDVARQGFFYASDEARIRRTLTGILGGNRTGLEQYVTRAAPVLLLSDNPLARETASSTAKHMGLPLQLLDPEIMDGLASVDLTTRMDGVEHEKAMQKYERYFADFSCVAGVLLTPNVSLLRNVNRILVKQEKAFVLGLIDGPFASVFATIAQQSGCFECYEGRLLARLEDTQVYYRFVEATSSQVRYNEAGVAFAPVSTILASAVLMEAALMSALGLSRLAGRVMSIYMPLLEIQMQDLLRIPYCPACGHIARNQMSEMYLNSQAVMNRMIERIELRKD